MARKNSKSVQEFCSKVQKRLKMAVDDDLHNRNDAVDDLNFANGDQWQQDEKKRRSDMGRPAFTINMLLKYIDQVVGDMLHNTPTIKITPSDRAGDYRIAQIRQGIINDVQYQSNSKGIYGYAAKQMVTSGYGAWRVLTRYTEENPFIQEAYLEGIRNPFVVYMDPTSRDQNYRDARWGIVLERMNREDFKQKYPKAVDPKGSIEVGMGLANELWYDDDTVTVAEYFEKTEEDIEMVLLEDGRVMSKEEFKQVRKDWKEEMDRHIAMVAKTVESAPLEPQNPVAPAVVPPQMTPSPQENPEVQAEGLPSPLVGANTQFSGGEVESKPKIAKTKISKRTVIKQWLLTSFEILDGGENGNTVAGKYIPIVLLKGKELNIEGKNYVYSLIRHAKDTQKLLNFWNTAAAETIALAPKAPWLATPKQIEGHEEAYASANVENFPVLLYNVDPEAPGAPQRQAPAQPPVAIFEQIRRAEDNIKSVIGMFNADIGAPGSEQTGAAITARQRPGDIATFEFSENLARAVMFTGEIINEMIPDIYDSERDIRVRGLDDSEAFVPVNTTVGDALKAVKDNPDRFSALDVDQLRSMFSKEGADARYNDITVGKYDVVVTVGPSYATQRQESAQHLLQLVQAMPQQMAMASDLIVENMDFRGSDELAARLRKTLPPGMAKPRKGDPPPQPQQPSPEMIAAQAKMQSEQAKVQISQSQLAQEQMKLELEKLKMQNEQLKIQAELEKTRLELGKELQPDPIEMARLETEQRRLFVELERIKHEQAKLEREDALGTLKAQADEAKLRLELAAKDLALQHEREMHQMRMLEMLNSKDPLGLRSRTQKEEPETETETEEEPEEDSDETE